jgi:hypothetical protein
VHGVQTRRLADRQQLDLLVGVSTAGAVPAVDDAPRKDQATSASSFAFSAAKTPSAIAGDQLAPAVVMSVK